MEKEKKSFWRKVWGAYKRDMFGISKDKQIEGILNEIEKIQEILTKFIIRVNTIQDRVKKLENRIPKGETRFVSAEAAKWVKKKDEEIRKKGGDVD